MIEQLKSIFQQIGQGLSVQHMGKMSIACSSTELFTEELTSAPKKLKPTLRFTFPDVLFIGNNILD